MHRALLFLSLPLTACDCGGGGELSRLSPSIEVFPGELVFALTSEDDHVKSVAIRNAGTGELRVSVSLDPNSRVAFGLEAASFVVPAGTVRNVDVRAAPTEAGEVTGTLIVESDDPSDPRIEVALLAKLSANLDLGMMNPPPSTSDCGHIEGIVCDVAGGPAVGARVSVDVGTVRETTTDANGHWRLDCLPPGAWTFVASSGSFSTSFVASVIGGRLTTLAAEECLDPRSAQVAVVVGAYDSMETVLDSLGIPNTVYPSSLDLLSNPPLLSRYDIVFFNCGFDEELALTPQAIGNLRTFVQNGGSVYASDLAYDLIEEAWPSYVDFFGDDTVPNDAEVAPFFQGSATVVDPVLVTALGGRSFVSIDSYGAAIESVANATVYIEGNRLQDGQNRPFMISFQPASGSGFVFYTDFHNSELAEVNTIFNWLIQQL